MTENDQKTNFNPKETRLDRKKKNCLLERKHHVYSVMGVGHVT